MSAKGWRDAGKLLFAVFCVSAIGGADVRAVKKLSDKLSLVAVSEIIGGEGLAFEAHRKILKSIITRRPFSLGCCLICSLLFGFDRIHLF